MKITLQVNGRDMTFTEQELTAIVEKHFSTQNMEQVNGSREVQAQRENKCLRVKPLTIDQRVFERKREDPKQEWLRQEILKAFSELKVNPERCKYGQPFKTWLPPKTWDAKKQVYALDALACTEGDHMADGFEQAFEWAQRIANGESWEAVCNEPDTADYYRIIRDWYNPDKFRVVGGSVECGDKRPAFHISNEYFEAHQAVKDVVPLIVSY